MPMWGILELYPPDIPVNIYPVISLEKCQQRTEQKGKLEDWLNHI